MKKVSNRPWGAAALVLVCGFAGAASAQPVLTNLGALPGFDYAWAEGLSPDGPAVTGFWHAAGGSEVFRWTRAGGMQSLGILPRALASGGQAISVGGAVIAGIAPFAGVPSNRDHAFVWTEETGLQELPMLPAGNYARAYPISADGPGMAGVGKHKGGH